MGKVVREKLLVMVVAEPSPVSAPEATAVRVLVVDDEATLTELLSMALRYEGWEVRTRRRRADRGAGRARSSARTPSCST